MIFASRFTGVKSFAAGTRLPGGGIRENIARQDRSGGGALGPARDVHLAEKDEPLALTEFEERAVLQGIAAFEDREEIAARWLFDEHRSDVAAIAAAPHARHINVAPLDGWAIARLQRVFEARCRCGCFTAPIVQMAITQPGQNGMV